MDLHTLTMLLSFNEADLLKDVVSGVMANPEVMGFLKRRPKYEKQVQEQIYIDKNGKYQIPQDLKIQDFPEDIVNGFLDWLSQFDEYRDSILKLIKDGDMIVECREE